MNTFYEQRPERLFIGGMTDYPVATHVHALAEVVIVTRGYALITIDEIQYRLKPGDAAVVFPLVPHSFDQLSEDSKGVIGIFPPDIIPEYAGTFHGLQPETPFLPAERTSLDLRFAVERLGVLNMDDHLPMCIAYLHVILACVLHSLTSPTGSFPIFPNTPMKRSPWRAPPTPWASAPPICPISSQSACIPTSAASSTPSGSKKPA